MKKLIGGILVFMLFSCNIKDYKYKIQGGAYAPPSSLIYYDILFFNYFFS